jgi:transposase
MLSMEQVELIHELRGKGLGPVAIAERLNITRKTVSKYMVAEVTPEQAPRVKEELPSKLDPFKPIIGEWLEEDRKHRYKQRHTAGEYMIG